MRHDLIAERRLIIFDPSPAHGKRSAAEQRDVESAISKSQMRLACRPHELDLFGRDRRCDQTGNKKTPQNRGVSCGFGTWWEVLKRVCGARRGLEPMRYVYDVSCFYRRAISSVSLLVSLREVSSAETCMHYGGLTVSKGAPPCLLFLNPGTAQ